MQPIHVPGFHCALANQGYKVVDGAITNMTREELHKLAQRTRDPSVLSDDCIARMKAAKVGPFAHSEEEWAAVFNPPKVET
jgi:hypothetical protein